ncbi:MAG: hypothetical protein WA217_10470, partial [Candidatus Binatus sp.]
MKSIVWLGAALFTLVIAAPASAQVTIQIGTPQVPGFSNYLRCPAVSGRPDLSLVSGKPSEY